MIKRIKKNEYSIRRADYIQTMIKEIEDSYEYLNRQGSKDRKLDPQKFMKECVEAQGPSELISIKTKKHKSLGVLSLVFIKLFFEKSKTLTIEEAVQFFNENEGDIQEGDLLFKSQTRRLYDIANVLKSLGIIQKVKYFQPKQEKNQKERKNAFKWIGAIGFNLDQDDTNSACNSVN